MNDTSPETFDQFKKLWNNLEANGWEFDHYEQNFTRDFTIGDFKVSQCFSLPDLREKTTLTSISAIEKYKLQYEAANALKEMHKTIYEREFCELNQLNYEEETAQDQLFPTRPIDEKLNDYKFGMDRKVSVIDQISEQINHRYTLISTCLSPPPCSKPVPSFNIYVTPKPLIAPTSGKWILPLRQLTEFPYPEYPNDIELDFIVSRDISEEGLKALIIFK